MIMSVFNARVLISNALIDTLSAFTGNNKQHYINYLENVWFCFEALILFNIFFEILDKALVHFRENLMSLQVVQGH